MADAQARLVISAKDATGTEFARVKQGLDGLGASAEGLAAKFSGMAIGLAAVAAVGSFRNIVDGVDALNDLKDATGASIENLSGLEKVAKLNGGTLENVSAIIVKFNAGLKDAEGDNGVSLALKAIGLDAQQLRQQDPALALQAVAVALDGYASSGDKARVIQELFGKSVREAAPFLKDLAEAGKLNGKVTTEQAEQAEKFNKQLYELKTNSMEFGRSIVADMIPALSQALALFKELKQGPGVFAFFLESVKGNNHFSTAQEGIDAYYARLQKVKAEMAAIENSKFVLFKSESLAQLEEKRKLFEGFIQVYRNLIAPEYSNEGRNAAAPKKQVDPNALRKPGKAEPDGATEFAALLDRLNKKSALITQEIALGRKLTESEQLQIEVEAQLAGAKTKLLEPQQAAIRAKLQEVAANARVLEQQTLMMETTKEIDKAIAAIDAKRFAKLTDSNEKQAERNAQLLEEFAAVGKTREQIEARAIAIERETIATKQSQLALVEKNDANVGQIEALQREIELLQQSAQVRQQILDKADATATDPMAGATAAVEEYLSTIRKAGESTKDAVGKTLGSLENALTDALTGKRVDAKALVDSILQEFVRLQVVKPLLASIFGTGSGAAAPGAVGLFAGLFGGFGGKFANGGHLGAGKWGIAGEAGAELIKGPAEVVPMSRMPQGIASGGGTIDLSINGLSVGAGVSRAEVHAAVAQAQGQQEARIRRLIAQGAI